VVTSRVLWKTPGPQPNGLQAAPDGLWVIDQVDDKIYKLSYADGSVLLSIPTRAKHSSGIALDPQGGVWVASTFGFELIRYDPRDGSVLSAFPTPEDVGVGAHALEWRNGCLWVNVPKLSAVFQLDPRDGSILHKIPAPGNRPHGMAWADGYVAGGVFPLAAAAGRLEAPNADRSTLPAIWCVETNHRAVFLLDPETGQARRDVKVDGPEPHGMTLWQGQFWLCDAATREVFVVDAPAV
jgi:streptogramin lyase